MKIYIAGAISDNPNYIEQFAEAEKQLIEEGHAVINPVKNGGFEYKEYIDMGLCELMKCEAIYLLKGFENSKGAQLEYLYAVTTGMQILREQPINIPRKILNFDELARLIISADFCHECEHFANDKCDFFSDLANENEPLYKGCFKPCKKYLKNIYA